jgi:citrate synthase
MSASDRAPEGFEWLSTSIGSSSADSITLRGRDLATEIMGQLTFTDLAFLLVAGRTPSHPESRLLDAVLVSLADHGLTPTVLAARLTHTGAPESLQGAVAAGLLGGGSVFLGPVSDTVDFLRAILGRVPAGDLERDHVLRVAAAEAVEVAVRRGRRIPGLGHPLHRHEDPRTPRLYQLARECGLAGPHLHLLSLVAEAHAQRTGRVLPINGAGAAGAALADLGFAPAVVRGWALLARTAGLVAHLAEEMNHPLGMPLWREIDRRANPRAHDPEEETPS